jgi:hypothetical protein
MGEIDSNKEFIPYNQAVALKELGYDEYCLRYFMMGILNPTNLTVNYDYFKEMSEINVNMLKYTYVLAPLYQQAFRWFRKKHNWTIKVNQTTKNYWSYTLDNFPLDRTYYGELYKSDEEAELECLKKLIEIINRK